jgi:hypothetical protein
MRILRLLVPCVFLFGCGDDAECTVDDAESCDDGLVCENVGDEPTCVKPVFLKGRVLDAAGAGIANARVTAVDANDAPVTGTAISAADGTYELRVPIISRTDKDTVPMMKVKLRAAAQGYDPFPFSLRPSLPIEVSAATAADDKLVLMSLQTDIVLFTAAAAAGTGSIAGTVQNGAAQSGALIVAEGTATVTGISDRDGAYVLFNVPAGSYTVSGYRAGINLAPKTGVAVSGGARTEPVDLAASTDGVATVSGSVNIVNPGMGNGTSIVLVVESTFNDALKRGEVPPGLRAPKEGPPSITNAFSIEGVPPGKYVVLAAFENDFLVRDPDMSIAGTAIQRITVAGAAVALAESFKITGSLDIRSPGAGDLPDVASATPTFVWKDDSSEDFYKIEVFDQRGTMVWMKPDVPKFTGGDAMVAYGGTALTSGYYWFRVTSFRDKAAGGATAISQTEDLRGVFEVK